MSNRYFKRPWSESRGDQFDYWGASTYFFEIEDSGAAIRQLVQYDKGPTLRYSTKRLEDAYGGLATVVVVDDETEWEEFEITADAFEEAWELDADTNQ